jgi:GT2 family glycosyltransferase
LSLSEKRFAIVVVAHREYATLEHCLRGFRSLVVSASDLIFVDNGSGGILAEQVAKLAPGSTLIRLQDNRHFCGGYNAGLRFAEEQNYEFVLIVNADTEILNRDFVARLIDAMGRHQQAAFIGPRVYYRDLHATQKTCLSFPNLMHNILVWIPFRLFPRLVDWQSEKEHEVDFLNGVCVLCRVKALREIGLMDERFMAYVEDADWAWRARRLGWSSVFVPVPSIIHHEETQGYEHYSHKSLLLRCNTVRWFLNAGKRRSARVYASASMVLAKVRALTAMGTERESYLNYYRSLNSAYAQLLSASSSPISTQDPATPNTPTS